jgi:hypothetical protein
MRRLRDNGLAIVFGVLFVVALVGQSFAGHADFNDRRRADHRDTVSYVTYVTSSDFAVDVAENWQSEYLQFFLFILATTWLVQRGSPESKDPDKVGKGSDEEQQVGEHARPDSPLWAKYGDWRTAVYARSLTIVMGLLFALSWLAQSIAGRSAFNEQRLTQAQAPVSWVGYVGSADFWNRTLQNWQSELLAVGSMVTFSIYLRHRGSSESKPVGAPHHTTGTA